MKISLFPPSGVLQGLGTCPCQIFLMVNSLKVSLSCHYLRMDPYDTLQQRMTNETLCNWAYFSLPQINVKLYLPCVKRLQRNYQRSHRADDKKCCLLVIGYILFWTDVCQVQLPLVLLVRNVIQFLQNSSTVISRL